MSAERQRHHRLVRRGLWSSLALCVAILLLGGVGFWALEPGIHSLQDGLWLAFTTTATVGYGDTVPKTEAGHLLAVLVVLLGLAVLSMVTALPAALFVERVVEAKERQIERDLKRETLLLRNQVRGVEQRLLPFGEPPPHAERSRG